MSPSAHAQLEKTIAACWVMGLTIDPNVHVIELKAKVSAYIVQIGVDKAETISLNYFRWESGRAIWAGYGPSSKVFVVYDPDQERIPA